MDFSYIFRSAIPDYDKFRTFGFEEKNGRFICRKKLETKGFYVLLEVYSEMLIASVFENDTDEKYVLFDVKTASGAFVSQIREEVKKIVENFVSSCFISHDLTEKYIDFIERKFSCKKEYPWAKKSYDTDSCVFRGKNDKWFALVMKISYRNIGIESDENVSAVNLKADSEIIGKITDGISVFPAYHMNKKHWITVLLTDVTDFEKLLELTEKSYELVMKKK